MFLQDAPVVQASLALGAVVVALVAGLVLKPYRDPKVGALATQLLVLQAIQLALALLGYLDVAGDGVVNVGLIACLVGAVGAVLRMARSADGFMGRLLCGGRGSDESSMIEIAARPRSKSRKLRETAVGGLTGEFPSVAAPDIAVRSKNGVLF